MTIKLSQTLRGFTSQLVEELGIHVIPMSFNFGDESYTHYPDEREYSAKDFF